MVFGADREFPPVYGMDWRPHRRVQLRYDATNATGASHHQKIVVIDDRIAFVGGLDFTCRRWDTTAHDPGDPRRTAGGKPYPPFHDAMIAVDGDAARGGERRRPRTLAGGDGKEAPAVRDRLRSVARGARARPCERRGGGGMHQPARGLAEGGASRGGALPRRDCRAPAITSTWRTSISPPTRSGRRWSAGSPKQDGPEIVVVTRLLSHGWLEEMTMHVLRERLVRRLRAADRHGRFHVYYPHIDGLAAGHLHRHPFEDHDRGRRVSADRLRQSQQPVDGPRHGVRSRPGGARAAGRRADDTALSRPAPRRARRRPARARVGRVRPACFARRGDSRARHGEPRAAAPDRGARSVGRGDRRDLGHRSRASRRAR